MMSEPAPVPTVGGSERPKPEAGYWKAAEASAYSTFSTKMLYRLADEDPSMPCLRVGRSVRFPRDRFIAWLRSREQGAGRPRRLAVVPPVPRGEAEAR
jgi:hypothetical protein